jgi:hypothetical protein
VTGDILLMAGLCVILAALAAAAIAAPTARRVVDQVTDRGPHTATTCGYSGWPVNESQVSLDGHLYDLCPGCGKTHVCCTIIDPNLPFGPWVVADHEPRIDPDLGLHDGECWANKSRTGDYGLCVCGRVESGLF